MRLKIGEDAYTLDGGIRVRELCEAEKALGMSLQDGGMGAQVAVTLFVIERRADPDKAAVLIADAVLDLDMSTVEVEEDEENPPAEPAPGPDEDEPEAPDENGSQPISGLPPLVPSA